MTIMAATQLITWLWSHGHLIISDLLSPLGVYRYINLDYDMHSGAGHFIWSSVQLVFSAWSREKGRKNTPATYHLREAKETMPGRVCPCSVKLHGDRSLLRRWRSSCECRVAGRQTQSKGRNQTQPSAVGVSQLESKHQRSRWGRRVREQPRCGGWRSRGWRDFRDINLARWARDLEVFLCCLLIISKCSTVGNVQLCVSCLS